MTDRFTYLPHIGLAVAVVWGAADILSRYPRPATVLAGAAVVLLAIAASRHVPVWRDSVAVFSGTIAVTGGNPAVQHFLAAALDDRGRFDDAFPHHAEAARLEPAYPITPYFYGLALERRGQTAAAIEQFQRALSDFPDYPDARRHLKENRKLLASGGSTLNR
jgi:tetratricopeptide (TPR) repeat protein